MATEVKKLNKAGIGRLADDLVARQRRYNQNTFGEEDNACNTVCCLAGFCLVSEMGVRGFNYLAKYADQENIQEVAVSSGIRILGINKNCSELPQLFRGISSWPDDLYEEYRSNGPRWRVIAALKALQRLLPDGTIDPNPKAVHTRLPQLTKLLKQTKAKGKRAA